MLVRLFFILSVLDLFVHVAPKPDDMSMADRWKQMSDLSYRSPAISMDNNRFKSLVRGNPRNYSVIAMFTALDERRQCGICREANDEFLITARSHRYASQNPGSVFFAVVDFDKAPDAFKIMKINTAPMFFHFPSKGTYKKSDVMDAQRSGISAEIIAKWVETVTDAQIRVLRPPNYAGPIGLIMLVSLFGFLIYIRRNNLEFLQNRTMWAVMALLFSFAMSSGQMWNHIRGPPFMQKTRNGGVAYTSRSSQSQFIAETYIVMLISALAVIGMIALIESAKSKSDVKVRRFMAIVGLGLFAFFYSLMLSVFKSKSGGYPYSFLIR